MPLPPDFHWIQAHQHEHGAPTALAQGDVQVVRLMDRLDGTWFARLDCHLGMDAPLALRDCTSFERGRRGAEEWVCRHEGRIRAEVAETIARRRKDKV